VWKTAVYLVVIVVLGTATALMARNVLTGDEPDEITLPTATTWTVTPRTVTPRTAPDTPSRRGIVVDSAGKTIVYRATINGVGVLAYSDGTGTRSAVVSEPDWTVTFTGTGAPLRLLVIATSGSAVTCSITVGGEVVASDEVTVDSSRRTAACLA